MKCSKNLWGKHKEYCCRPWLILCSFLIGNTSYGQVFQKLTVTNDLNFDRSEIIAIRKDLLHTTVKKHAKKAFRIKREGTDSYLPTQWYDSDFDGIDDQILLHVIIPAGSILSYDIVIDSIRKPAVSDVRTAVFKHKGYIYWENETQVFRTPEESKKKLAIFDFGIKPTAQALASIEKRLKKQELPFKSLVSNPDQSLGLGATVVLNKGVLEHADKIEKLEILADGPLRTVFLLHYPAWGSQNIGEIKRITIDKGALFTHIDVFMTEASKALGYAIVAEGSDLVRNTTTDVRYHHLQERLGEQSVFKTIFFPYESPKEFISYSRDSSLGAHYLFMYRPKDRFSFSIAYQLVPKFGTSALKEWEQTVKNYELCRSNPLKTALKLPRE